MHKENVGSGYASGLLGENKEDKQEQYKHTFPRFHYIYMDGKTNIARIHPFKRGAKSDSLRLRDIRRNIKICSLRSLSDSSSSLQSLRKTEERSSQGNNAYGRRSYTYKNNWSGKHYCL